MNANAFHNIANVVIALMGVITAAMLATGCTTDIGGNITSCTGSWLNPAWTAGLIAVLGVAKTVVNIMRDGIGNLFNKQPPVQNKP